MVPKETSVERLSFTCTGCQTTWQADYDVQHVDDGHGHDRDYYFHDGLPCSHPTGRGAALCPHCGRDSIIVRPLTRRASPAITTPTPQHPGEPPTPERTANRNQAPLLPGTHGVLSFPSNRGGFFNGGWGW